MRTSRLPLAVWCVLAALILAACGLGGASTATPAGDALNVTVSIAPQQYFCERIGGDRVSVNVMVPPGADPHTFEPSAGQMRALARSSLYLTIGEQFEQAWMERFLAANPDLRVVDTSTGIEKMAMEEASDTDAETGAHEAEELDPHIWLSPSLVKVQAATTARALSEQDPTHAAEYEANLAAFVQDIDALDQDIRATLAGATRQQFIVFHPSWGYFARDYGLEQIAIEVGGQEPSAAELAQVIDQARQDGIHVILAQPEFSTTAAETIAREIDGRVLLADPLAEDWLDNMRSVANTFAEALD